MLIWAFNLSYYEIRGTWLYYDAL